MSEPVSSTPSPATPATPLAPASSYTRDRIVALSDGVYSIAITLLAFAIVPTIAGSVTGPQFVAEIVSRAPDLVAFVVTFLLIGRFWDTHRIFFRYISVGDYRVSWLNLLVLLWIALLPASEVLLRSHWQEPVAITFYALNLVLAMASYWLLWRYVCAKRYVREEALSTASNLHIERFVGLSVLGFALAIPIAFLSPLLALVVVVLTTIFARVIARRVLTSSAAPPGGAGS
jgi:uncharacterized membrane protein